MAPAPRGLCSVLQGCRVRVTVLGSTRACTPHGMTVKWAWGTLNSDKSDQTPKSWLLFYKQSWTWVFRTHVSVHHQDFQPFPSQLKLRCSQYESLMETVFSIIKISSLSDQRMSTARAVSFVWWQIVTILPRKKGSELRGGCCRKAPVFHVFNVHQDCRSCPFRRRCKLDLTQWLSQQLLLLLLLSCMFGECGGRTDYCEGGVLWASGL